jgi:hypothetical protein
VGLAVLCVVSGAQAAPALVQHSVSNHSNVTSVTTGLPDAATPGDVVVIAVWWDTNPSIAVFDNLDASCAPVTPAFNYGSGLIGQMFVVTVNDAGPFAVTYVLVDAGAITPYRAEFSGAPAHVEDQSTQTGDAAIADSGTVNASAGALLIGWNVLTGAAGDAGSFTVLSRFQQDLFAYMIAPDAGPYALTTEETSEFGLPIRWGSQLISLAPPRPDAGSPDAGSSDGGSADAGAPDAGAPAAGNAHSDAVACGCSDVDALVAVVPLWLAAVAALKRAAARRARAARSSPGGGA